jgi:hypothetical protein
MTAVGAIPDDLRPHHTYAVPCVQHSHRNTAPQLREHCLSNTF